MIACQRCVMQFKVTLMRVKPAIWRRIVVPETYSFWDLHVAIQDAMGWLDSHLHMFEVADPSAGETVRIGIPPDEAWDAVPLLPGWALKIADVFRRAGDRARYEYDFGDSWHHAVVPGKPAAGPGSAPIPRVHGRCALLPARGCRGRGRVRGVPGGNSGSGAPGARVAAGVGGRQLRPGGVRSPARPLRRSPGEDQAAGAIGLVSGIAK